MSYIEPGLIFRTSSDAFSLHEFDSAYDLFNYLRYICMLSFSRNSVCTFSQIFGIFEITFQFEISSLHSQDYFLFYNLLNLRTDQVIFTQLHRNRKKADATRTLSWTWKHDEREQQTLGPSPQSQAFSFLLSCVYNVIRASRSVFRWTELKSEGGRASYF